MSMKIVKRTVLIISLLLLLWFLTAQFVDVEHVIITVNVPVNSSVSEVEDILEVFAARGVKGTFFVPGIWAVDHEELVMHIAANHELACYTYSDARLAQLSGENLSREVIDCKYAFENLTNGTVDGFRAPANDVGLQTYPLIAEHYRYDSSLYGRYGWFWERPPDGFIEVPITSVLVLPLDDWFGLRVFHLGDFFFWLAKQAKQEPVVMAVTVGTVNDYVLNMEFLLAHYQKEGANITTVRDWLG